MFHKRTGHIAAITASLCLMMIPTASYANGLKAPTEQAQSVQTQSKAEVMLSQIKDISLADVRFETKSKLSDTRQWVKDTKVEQKIEYLMDDLDQASHKLQDRVAPAGASMKSFMRNKLPGQSLAAAADRTVTVFGLLLILSFAIVVFLLSSTNPVSRLGGRH